MSETGFGGTPGAEYGGEVCHVCRESLDSRHAVACVQCERKVHFDPSESAACDCAVVVTRPDACAVSFLCRSCYEKASFG